MKEITWNRPGNLVYWKMCEELLDNGGHMLIAGRTGSGKSVTINDYLYSITALRTPASARFVLIDPKRVELKPWSLTPFTWIYANEQRTIVNALDAVIAEMERRYKQMEKTFETLYRGCEIWVIIDELADLMTTCRREFLPRLQRVLNLGRAARINVIMGTQSPSRKTIPAEIQLNTTYALALSCKSAVESRQVLGVKGAEDLPRYGYGMMSSPEGITTIKIPMTPKDEIFNRIKMWTEPERKTVTKKWFAWT